MTTLPFKNTRRYLSCGALTVGLFVGAAQPALAQDFWSVLLGQEDSSPRSTTGARSWRTTIDRTLPVRSQPVPADPAWTATIAYAKVPLAAANPIPRAAPRTVNPLTGKSHVLEGIASYYWQEQTTASGERFDRTGLTAAHKTLPLNTRVRVTNVVNGRSIVVRINDRGPFKPGRVIDLSEAAARHLDMQALGLVPVRLQVISN